MTNEPFSLTGEIDPGAKCQKCAQLARDGAKVSQKDATHTLVQGTVRWPLCSNHSAAVSWALGIPHPAFNPTGQRAQPQE